jgi:hypothetical protein
LDFTLITYKRLLNTLSDQGFSFQTLTNFLEEPGNKIIVIRHDVDKLPGKSLDFARIQADLGIIGTYYFRIKPQSFDEKIIKEIYLLGHEIGYHYEEVSLTAERQKTKDKRQKWKKISSGCRAQSSEQEEELAKIAIESFAENLEKLRKIVPVKTICMHGSPRSIWDSRLLWKYYDYHDFGIIGEPYLDINFNEVLYLTDTGRRWDGNSYNVRDKATGDRRQASGKNEMERGRGGEGEKDREESRIPLTAYRKPFPKFHSTFDIIRAAEQGELPDKIMMTFHPQRWTDKPIPWLKELIWQNVKNVVKYFLVKSLCLSLRGGTT